MRANALLIQSDFGWSYETVDPGDNDVIENFLLLGSLPSEAEVSRRATIQLQRYAVDQTQITVQIEPVDTTDTPGFGFHEGDTVIAPDGVERVVAYTVARDATGKRNYEVTLRSRIREQAERIDSAITKMAPGSFRGDSRVSSPLGSRATGSVKPPAAVDRGPVVWNQRGDVALGESDPYPVIDDRYFANVAAAVSSSSSTGSIDFDILVDGAVEGSGSIPAGDYQSGATLGLLVAAGSVVTIDVTSTGTGASGLVVSLS